jgi:serine protease AprX
MKNKPMVLILLFLLIPFAAINSISAQNQTNDNLVYDIYSSDLVNVKDEGLGSVKSSNIMDSYWQRPMKIVEIWDKISVCKNRALISFFTFEERDLFMEHLSGTDVSISRIYRSIPAISVEFDKGDFANFEFESFDIKYIYPLGSYNYYAPQNIDMDLGGRVELSDIREALEIDALHELGYTGHGITVAVLDSGITATENEVPSLYKLKNYDELKIVGNVQPSAAIMNEDIDDLSGHGTHIASILAGNGLFVENNKLEETEDYGIAPDAKIYNVKVLDRTGFGEDQWLIDGFDEALNPSIPGVEVDIISASLTSLTFNEMSDPILDLVSQANDQGVLVVSSAGNYGPSGSSIGAPAISDFVMSIGATQSLDDLAIYTSKGLNLNFSSGIDILAPGNGVGGADAETGGKDYRSGTSVSAPIVSGVLALLLEAFPDLDSHHKYEAAILETAADINKPIVSQGNGIIDPLAAYIYLDENNDLDMFSLNPKRISPVNLYYYSCVEGENTQYKAKIVSSVDQILDVSVFTSTNYFIFPSTIQVYEGWNHFSFNISIPLGTKLKDISATVILKNADDIEIRMNINIQTRYLGGKVLFDVSHDNDTGVNSFDSSSPIGTHIYLARRLKDNGFQVLTHWNGTYDFSNIDILVISDPELGYSTEELTAISDFVQDGGSLLFLVNSIRLVDSGFIEEEPIISSNYTSCEQILEMFDIVIFDGMPIPYVPYKAVTTTQATMLNVDEFFFWGWPVVFDQDSTNEYNRVLAEINPKEWTVPLSVALSTEIGDGRIMVFGSGYPFTDLGLVFDSFENSPSRANLTTSYKDLFSLDDLNNQLVNDSFDWLISNNRPLLSVQYIPEKFNTRESFTIQIAIQKKDGAPYFAPGNEIEGTIIYPDHSYYYFTLSLTQHPELTIYAADLSLPYYGQYTIFVPLKLQDHTATDGRILLFGNVPLWKHISLIQGIAAGTTAFIIVAVILIPTIRMRFRRPIKEI